MPRLLLFFGLIAFFFGCERSLSRQFVSQVKVDPNTLIPTSYSGRNPCTDKMNYMPDPRYPDHIPLRYLRVNFHIMCKKDGSGNFSEEQGITFINQVLDAANDKLSRNKQMRLPLGNDTEVLPMGYRYKLTPRPNDPDDDGIYFHYDDNLYFMLSGGKHQNNYDKDVYVKYGVMKDTVLNVFVMGAHQDSMQSKTYRPGSRGIGFGPWCKVGNWFNNIQDTVWKKGKPTMPKGKWYCQKLLNHEIGHCLGLRHTWRSNDGCEDTPTHPNCWNKAKTPPCDSLWGNNFMDYNAHASAWSPCQIATIHHNLTERKKKIRKLLEPVWCKLDEKKTIYIDDKIDWLGAKDIHGNLHIRDGGELTIRCRASFPKGGKLVIHPKGKLILDGALLNNDCGEDWLGIERLKKGKQLGEIVISGDTRIEQVVHPVEILEVEAAKSKSG